jgi:hypothetical protein
MSETVMSHTELLRALHRATPAMRHSILKASDCGLIRSICECADNTLKGHVKLTSLQKTKLSRHKKILRKLVRRGQNWRAKKQLLLQRGGSIIPLILSPILGSILSSLFN